MPAIMLRIKNGSQQIIKTPITVPRVLAALASLLNIDFFLRRLINKKKEVKTLKKM